MAVSVLRSKTHPETGEQSSPTLAAITTLARAVRFRWWVVLLVAVPWIAASILYVRGIPPQHSAVSVVAIVPDNAEATFGDLITITASRYAVALTSASQLEAVSANTGVSVDDLRGAVRVETTADSGNIQVTATSPDSETALAVADAVADQTLKLGETVDGLKTVKVAPAVLQGKAVASSPAVLLTVLSVAGLVLALWLAFTLERLRPRVLTEKEAQRVSGVPSMGRLSSRGQGALLHVTGAHRAALLPRRALIRSSVSQVLPGVPRRLALIGVGTSVGPATVAYQLAQSLSLLGERVLLIDGDVREATLTQSSQDLPTSSLTQALQLGRLPDVESHGTVHLLGRTVGIAAEGAADQEAAAEQLAALIAERNTQVWDTVMLTAPTFDSLGELQQVPVAIGDAVLVIPTGVSVSAVVRATQLMRRLNVNVRGVVLFDGSAS